MDPISIAIMLASKFAPDIIGKLTGSDASASVATKVIDIAKTVTGYKDPAEAAAALERNTEMAAEFSKQVMENDKELTQMYLADVQSARAMQIAALQQEDQFSKRFIYWFAWYWSVVTAVYFGCVTFMPLPPAGQRVADTILGVLITSVIGVIFNFFYGTSKGSQKKDDTLNVMAKKS